MATSVVVARAKPSGLEYLTDEAGGVWTEAAAQAARYLTLREATRAAMRLPSRLKAFALPVNR